MSREITLIVESSADVRTAVTEPCPLMVQYARISPLRTTLCAADIYSPEPLTPLFEDAA